MSGRRAAALVLREVEANRRTRQILADLARLRAVSGAQLDALHFRYPSPTVGATMRRRVLGRLVRDGLVATLPRAVGGVEHGSAGHVYTLTAAGHRLLPRIGLAADRPARVPPEPSVRFLAHTLAISGLYVALRDSERSGDLQVTQFTGEPGCWHRTGYGDVLKPDAYTIVQRARMRHLWWVEVDRATESIPALRHKLTGYLTFALSGHGGPDITPDNGTSGTTNGGTARGRGRVVPRVLLTTPNPTRHERLAALLDRLPYPAAQLIQLTPHDDAAPTLARRLATDPTVIRDESGPSGADPNR